MSTVFYSLVISKLSDGGNFLLDYTQTSHDMFCHLFNINIIYMQIYYIKVLCDDNSGLIHRQAEICITCVNKKMNYVMIS